MYLLQEEAGQAVLHSHTLVIPLVFGYAFFSAGRIMASLIVEWPVNGESDRGEHTCSRISCS